MRNVRFEWDENKNKQNQQKHGVSFHEAQRAFVDSRRVIAKDVKHQEQEDHYFCMGEVGGGIVTVRFTFRNDIIRIFGAGYWRVGKKVYEKENKLLG